MTTKDLIDMLDKLPQDHQVVLSWFALIDKETAVRVDLPLTGHITDHGTKEIALLFEGGTIPEWAQEQVHPIDPTKEGA